MLRKITRTLTIHRHTATVNSWGEPEETPIEQWGRELWDVYAVAPTGQQIPFADGRKPVIGDRTIYAPATGVLPDIDDLISFPNEEGFWALTGEPAVWDHNPHTIVTRERGVVVTVERRQR